MNAKESRLTESVIGQKRNRKRINVIEKLEARSRICPMPAREHSRGYPTWQRSMRRTHTHAHTHSREPARYKCAGVHRRSNSWQRAIASWTASLRERIEASSSAHLPIFCETFREKKQLQHVSGTAIVLRLVGGPGVSSSALRPALRPGCPPRSTDASEHLGTLRSTRPACETFNLLSTLGRVIAQ